MQETIISIFSKVNHAFDFLQNLLEFHDFPIEFVQISRSDLLSINYLNSSIISHFTIYSNLYTPPLLLNLIEMTVNCCPKRGIEAIIKIPTHGKEELG